MKSMLGKHFILRVIVLLARTRFEEMKPTGEDCFVFLLVFAKELLSRFHPNPARAVQKWRYGWGWGEGGGGYPSHA